MLILLCLAMYILVISSSSFAETGRGMPIKYLSSCELDLNNDDKPDIAFLIETVLGRELIVLIRNDNGYESYVLVTGKQDMYMTCHFGKEIKETIAGKGKKKVKIHKTNGTYLQVIYPETSSVAYFWKDNKFKKIWTSD